MTGGWAQPLQLARDVSRRACAGGASRPLSPRRCEVRFRRARRCRIDGSSTSSRPTSVSWRRPGAAVLLAGMDGSYAMNIESTEGKRRRTRGRGRGARALSTRPDARARPARRPDPDAQAPGPHGHLHHRPQRQLHQRLRREVQLLRVLPRRRLQRRLRARLRRDLQEDRRDDRGGRRPAAAAGRAQSRPAADVVRGSVPRDQVAISRISSCTRSRRRR